MSATNDSSSETFPGVEQVGLMDRLNHWAASVSSGQLYKVCLYLGLSLITGYLFVVHSGDSTPSTGSERLAQYTADMPFQSRILLPFIAHWLVAWTGWTARYWFDVFSVGFLIPLPFLVARILRHWMPSGHADIAALLVFPPIFVNYVLPSADFYCYDIPCLTLFTAGLAYLLDVRESDQLSIAKYFAAFLVGIINRETEVLLILAFALIWFRRLPIKEFSIAIAVQIVLFATFKLTVDYIFRANTGAVFYNQFNGNLHLLRLVFHGASPAAVTWGVCAFYWVLIPFGWSSKPREVRLLHIVALASLICLAFVGVCVEVRIYGEIAIILTLGAAFSLRQLCMSILDDRHSTSTPLDH